MPCVQDWPHDPGPDRSSGAFGCTIAAARFLMNDLFQQTGFLQTAFTQAEGELCPEVLFRREGATATAAGPELPIVGVRNGRPMRYRIPHAYPTIQRSKTIQSP